MFDSVGGGQVVSIPEVLGTQVPIDGEYGISKNPESFAKNGNDVFFSDARRGLVLKMNGEQIFEISSYGLNDYFREVSQGCCIRHGRATTDCALEQSVIGQLTIVFIIGGGNHVAIESNQCNVFEGAIEGLRPLHLGELFELFARLEYNDIAILYGGIPHILDPRTAICAFGSPEQGLMALAMAPAQPLLRLPGVPERQPDRIALRSFYKFCGPL
jgi:hypothetical protein